MNVLTSILLICAAGLTLAWFIAAQRRLVARLAHRFLALPRLQQVALVLAVGVMTVCAQKSGTNGVTTVQSGSGVSPLQQEELNFLNRSGETPLPPSSVASAISNVSVLRAKTSLTSASASPCESAQSVDKNLPRVTTNDAARGYALVEARTNETVSYEMPTKGVEVGTWGKTGAYQDVVRVGLSTDYTDFHGFVWGDEVITSFWVHAWGKVRPRLRDRAPEIVAVGTPMSVVAGEGRLWTAATTNGTWVITWENFVEGRREREIIATDRTDYHGLEDTNATFSAENGELRTETRSSSQASATSDASVLRAKNSDLVSAQIEFFPNGDFITRSNNVECVYRRVNPDDWDDDGIENEEDDEPMVSAEKTQFGPQQTLPDGANSNAYYWVDLVVSRANAKVTFAGDGESNLTDPSFIAKAGETNRVTLLIGKTYTATCAFPFKVVAKSSEEIEETWNGENEVDLCWPVSISFVADGDAASDAQAAVWQMQVVDSNNGTLLATPLLASAATTSATTSDSFSMVVIPSWLGGSFAWTNYCCSITGSAYAFEQACVGNCGCGGCTAEGRFVYEGYSIVSPWGPSCRCSDPDDDDDSPSRGVSAYFSKNVIIFEDEYDNSPTEHVGWRSTETVLNCSVNGGTKGGFAYFSLEGADGLIQYEGPTLPYSKSLEPEEKISFKCRYRATQASESEGDIKVTATFVENETWATQDVKDKATAVQIELTPYFEAPDNDCENRHKYGVHELVYCTQAPSSPAVSWAAGNGEMESANWFRCPIQGAVNPLSVTYGTLEYIPKITVIEPNEVVVENPGWTDLGAPVGDAGSLLMLLPFYIGPFDVSFYGIAVEEVPYDDDPWSGDTHTGYFSRKDMATWWHHTRENGAGVWLDVEEKNRLGGESTFDYAGVGATLSRVNDSGLFVDDPSCRWSDGVINFGIPFGWNKRETSGNAAPQARFAENVRAELILQEDGTFTVRKLGNEATRYVDGRVFLNGERKK